MPRNEECCSNPVPIIEFFGTLFSLISALAVVISILGTMEAFKISTMSDGKFSNFFL
jgi:hypothetical protein